MLKRLNEIYEKFTKLQLKYTSLEVFSDDDPYLQGYLDAVQDCRNIMTVEIRITEREEKCK